MFGHHSFHRLHDHLHRHHFGGGGRHWGDPGDFSRGSFGPFGGGFGGGMRPSKMLSAQDLQLIILYLLTERPRHGYEVIKALEEQSSGIYSPSPGMVYPALTYLEEVGFASQESEGNRKLYGITPEGSAHLEQRREIAKGMWAQLGLFGQKFSRAHTQFAQDEALAEQFDQDGQGRRGQRHQLKAELRSLRDELKAAIFEKIDSPAEEKQRVLDVIRRAIAEIRGR